MPQNPCCSNYPGAPYWTGWWDFGWNRPKSSNMPPSPTPPWMSRGAQNPLVQVISMNDTVNLGMQATFLNQVLNTPPAPVTVNLPNGNFVNQAVQIMIRSDLIAGTETFIVVGTFAGGFTKLTFNTIGWSALLMWDGAGWVLQGGNAALS